MITDKNHTQTESYTSGKMLYWDSEGYINRKESEITAYLASKSLTREQRLLLSPTQPAILPSLKALSQQVNDAT